MNVENACRDDAAGSGDQESGVQWADMLVRASVLISRPPGFSDSIFKVPGYLAWARESGQSNSVDRHFKKGMYLSSKH